MLDRDQFDFLRVAHLLPCVMLLGSLELFFPFLGHFPEILLFILPLNIAFYCGIWWLIIAGWRRASLHFKRALPVLGIACLLGWGVLDLYKNRIDWTPHGLNPNRPGFKPQVVVLAGTCSGSSQFEIRMRGSDYYYCKRWHGRSWNVGSRYDTTIAVPGFCANMKFAQYTRRKGGGGGRGNTNICFILPGRRLWNEAGFIGLGTNALVQRGWYGTEEFKQCERYGPYLIPKKIVVVDERDEKVTYTIRKVEFLSKPTEEWFEQVKQKHWDSRTNSMDIVVVEPGISRDRRQHLQDNQVE